MASLLSFKKILLIRSVVPAAAGASSLRFFSTNRDDQSRYEDCSTVKVYYPRFAEIPIRNALYNFIHAIHPFSPPTNVTQVLNEMENFRSSSAVLRGRHWDVKETAENLCINVSGFDEDVNKVWVKNKTIPKFHRRPRSTSFGYEYSIFGYSRFYKYQVVQNGSVTLFIEEVPKGCEDEADNRGYTIGIDLPKTIYKTNDIKIEVKEKILKVVVPKLRMDLLDNFKVKIRHRKISSA